MDPSQIPPVYPSNLPMPQQQPVSGSVPSALPADPLLPNIATPVPPVALGQAPIPVPPVAAASPSYNADSPQVADDVDLIEKEWVLKAKAIVAKTRDDPNKQTADMNRFKADYLKTRYSKDIRVSES